MKKFKFILTIFLLLIIYSYISFITLIPDNVILLNNEKIKFKNMPAITKIETTMTSLNNSNVTNVEFRLFGNVLLKTSTITQIEKIKVVPVGKIIGLKLYTDGVLVVGISENEENNVEKESDINPGDIILEINGKIVKSINALKEIVNNSKGEKLKLTIMRNGNILNTNIIPTKIEGEKYQLGLWVKDAATGVGTMTFYEPESKKFAILGHGITDPDTNKLIKIDYGDLVTAKVISLKRGIENEPGEIKGTIINSQSIGKIDKNTQFGVFGILNNLTALNIDTSKEIEIASRDEIEEGEARIICSINTSNTPKEYKIEIQKVYKENDYNNKSMLIKIIDEELLKETGGIIRGLSGAPIIQNGKFVGAVTNVLVSNPEIGYAVFADKMLKESNKITPEY